MRSLTTCVVAAMLLQAAPASACKDGEYSLSSYTKGDKYELDRKALELEKETGTPVAGGCVDCNDKGPYAERKADLDAKKKRLRDLRKNAEDEGKAALQKKFNDARADYNTKSKRLRDIDARIGDVDRQLRQATDDARKKELQERKTQLEEQRRIAADELQTAKVKLDGARKDLQEFQAMIEAIKKEIVSLEQQTSDLTKARSSCEKPCPPSRPGTIGQCR